MRELFACTMAWEDKQDAKKKGDKNISFGLSTLFSAMVSRQVSLARFLAPTHLCKRFCEKVFIFLA